MESTKLRTKTRKFISERFAQQAVTVKKDPIMNVIGIGTGDGAPVAREHDKYLYAKRKKGYLS